MSRPLALAALLLAALAAMPARASLVSRAEHCLATYDLPCAAEARDALAERRPDDPDSLRVQAKVAFYEGDYARAVAALDRLAALGVDTSELEARMPVRATAEAARDFVSVRRDGVVVRFSPGVDRILADEAIDTLAAGRRACRELFGAVPDHPIVVDIYPTASRFIAASGLPPEAVRTTGVVALSKWSRLLLTSPRALALGYAWKDTIVHEYIHLVVAWRTDDRAPVWLQEGLARHFEAYWRGLTEGHLQAHDQSLLARALKDDAFVPFEKFRRSMAYLDSGEEAALAFAQVSTMVRFLVERGGLGVLPRLLDRVRDGEEPQDVVADLAGEPDFAAFEADWRAWLGTLPLVAEELAQVPVVLEGEGDDLASDPLLAGRPDLARFVRLGDLLREAKRPRAALVEYAKAEPGDDAPSPLLLAREAACHEDLGELDEALRLVDQGLGLYAEFTPLQVARGRLLDAAGRTREAVEAWKAAHDLNPYDPEVQRALVADYQALGEEALARRHLRYARILATGGAITEAEGESPGDPPDGSGG